MFFSIFGAYNIEMANPVITSNYTPEQLSNLGVSFGRNVSVHSSVVFFNPGQIFIKDDVRIDCFSMISAGSEGVHIGSNVHLAAGCYLFGGGGKIELEDFCGLSSRVSLYTATDDYTEGYLSNPTVPEEFKKVRKSFITIGKHVLVGAGSVVLPGVKIGEGAAVGALTLVTRSIPEFKVVSGCPAKLITERNKDRIKQLEKEFYEKKL